VTGRRLHYELAFEDYLRRHRLPYVAVHEARRAIGQAGPIKAFDFIVYSRRAFNLLVDVKGRRLPDRKEGVSRFWNNWSTVDDLTGLDRWQRAFGPDFRAALAFVYELGQADPTQSGFTDVHVYRERGYGLVAVSLEAYQRHQRPRSARWQTVSVPQRIFRLICRPMSYFLGTQDQDLPSQPGSAQDGATSTATVVP
jgi:hypothetical protein